jgi:hypothetical protein
MSDYQFTKYENIRKIEREKERKKKKKGNVKNESANISSYYRVFSRAFCNFVFPETIHRPLPGDKDKKNTPEKDEDEDIDVDFGDEEENKKKQNKKRNQLYEQGKVNALMELEKQSNVFLKEGENGLDKYSPKFLLMLKNINKSPGSVFIYSQFRSIEGVGIFSLVLKANGYAPFRLNKNKEDGNWEIIEEPGEEKLLKYAFYSGTEDEEYKNVIKNIFNNDLKKLTPTLRAFIEKRGGNLHGGIIKALLATASAAEGISLANVRQVHITEPYWNPVRIEQVMGRAVRICSHSKLPLEERHVEVFLYISEFTKKQLDGSFTITSKDKGLSSDEAIYKIAERKNVITSNLFRLMKESSIDCSLNSVENEPLKCYSFGSRSKQEDYSTIPDISHEYVDNFKQEKTQEFNAIKIRYPPKTGDFYALNKETGDVYDLGSWETAVSRGGRPIKVGKIVEKDGKKEVELLNE